MIRLDVRFRLNNRGPGDCATKGLNIYRACECRLVETRGSTDHGGGLIQLGGETEGDGGGAAEKHLTRTVRIEYPSIACLVIRHRQSACRGAAD